MGKLLSRGIALLLLIMVLSFTVHYFELDNISNWKSVKESDGAKQIIRIRLLEEQFRNETDSLKREEILIKIKKIYKKIGEDFINDTPILWKVKNKLDEN